MTLLQDSDMEKDMLRAVGLIKNEGFTMAAVRDDKVISDQRRGVQPLLTLIDESVSLKGFSVADKVIGRAAAFLYVLLEAEKVYALTVSKTALEVFREYRISVSFDNESEMIRNRDNTGRCPMEQAVLGTNSPEEVLVLIREKLDELKNKH